MKEYVEPKLKVETFSIEDVITESNTGVDTDENPFN